MSPLVLDGDVYVSGDVVISGYVSGRGRLIAQGNVYVTGDIRYACDEDSLDFEIKGPTDCSYSEPETLPRIALAALGNIAIGPYQARQLGEEAKAALPSDVIAKRFSCADVEACTAGDSDAFYQDYHDPGSRVLTNDSPNYSLSATMAQLALLNQAAFEGASGARFYKMRDDSPIYRCERSSATDSYCETYDDPRLLEVAASSLPSDANIFSLGPRGDWLAPAASPTDLASESALRERWTRNVESSSRASGALHIDGALQAGGAVLGYLPTGSNTAGELVLQGSLLASDTALLATGGAALLYDQRLESVLGTQDQQAIVLDRRSYRLLSETESERLVRHTSKTGVTLIEILLVLAVVGIFLTLSTPLLRGFRARLELQSAQRSFVETLNRARSESRRTSVDHSVTWTNQAINLMREDEVIQSLGSLRRSAFR